MITLKSVFYSINGKQILNDVSMQVSGNQHVALVGRNGSGKSTIMKIIQGILSIDQGSLELSKNKTILSVDQSIPGGDLTPLEWVISRDQERESLFKELETCEDANRLSDIYERLLQIDAYSAESRAAKVLKGLGFDEEGQNAPLKSFSGGWRMRVALASVLFQEPDLLLLDEPTNHLDIETVQWLQGFLKKYPKNFLLISHDRDFLNEVTDHIWHLKNKNLTYYKGNFDKFLVNYELREQNVLSYNKKLEEKRDHMMKFVNKYRAKASKAKQAQSRLKLIEKMNFIPVAQDDPTVKFEFPEPEQISDPIIAFDNVFVGYNENNILKNISGSVYSGDRIALIGTNGSGKTTCAKFLFGDLVVNKGKVRKSEKLRIAFYRQDQLEQLDLDLSLHEQIERYLPGRNSFHIRTHLGKFGFSGDDVYKRTGTLSGGEKARLLFACLTSINPHILLLDEPTNHLDMEMRESLINTINNFAGTVILITHDKYLLQHTADSLWLIKNGRIENFNGTIEEYEKIIRDAA